MKITALPREAFAKWGLPKINPLKKWRLPKLVISLFLLSAFYFLLAANPTNAQNYSDEKYSASSTLNTSSNVALNSHNAVQVLFIDFLSAISCQLSGIDPTNPDGKCLGVNRETGEIGFVENGGGAIAVMGRLIDMTLTPPTSSLQYIAYLRDNFGIAKNAYAQEGVVNPCINGSNGFGFCSIEPLLPIWIAMRNIVYLIFILVFIIIGMGIMLRLHIDPRTVMTIQNQIPKIIVGILAITFSFAIAGLLIDFMWVTIYLFASVIISATGLDPNAAIKITQATDPFQAVNAGWNAVDPNAGFGIFDIASRTATSFSDIVEASLMEFSKELGPLWNLFGGALDIIITIILFIAILILLIRLFITLLMAFVNIILDIIFAPWWILAGLLPGGPLGLGAWMRDLIANLAVFPVAIGFMLLAAYLMSAFTAKERVVSDLSGLNFPMLGASANPAAIGVIIGFGFILMLPNLLSSVKVALKTPKMNFGPMFGPVGAAVSYPKNVASSVGGIWAGRKEYHMKEDPGSKDGYSWGQKGIGGSIKQRIFR